MVGAILSVIGLGLYEVGGISYVWEKAQLSDRTQFFMYVKISSCEFIDWSSTLIKLDPSIKLAWLYISEWILTPDPDTHFGRQLWAVFLCGFLFSPPLRLKYKDTILYLLFVSLDSNFLKIQSHIDQSICTNKIMHISNRCLLFNMIGMMLVIILCSIIGLMIYAEYHQCDPVAAKVRCEIQKLKKHEKNIRTKKFFFFKFFRKWLQQISFCHFLSWMYWEDIPGFQD